MNNMLLSKMKCETNLCVDVSPPGEHKLNFIPAMIGPFLEVTLVPQPDLRNVMIPIFHDMMDWEQRKNGNFKQVRKQTHPISFDHEFNFIHSDWFVRLGGGGAYRQAGQFGV